MSEFGRPLLLLIVALSCVAPAPRALAQDDEDEPLLDLDEGEESDSANEESTQTDGTGEMAEPDGDAIEDEEEALESEDEGSEFDAASGRSIAYRIGVGLGGGTLSFKRPGTARPQRMPELGFAAAALEVHLHAYPDDAFSVDIELEYETSLGFVVQVPKRYGLPQNINVRLQRVALTAAPMFRLGDEKGSPTLVFPIGFGFDAFTPEVDEQGLVEYSLGGPLVRAELWADLGKYIGLRLGPELQWLVLIDDALRNEQVCCQGVAVGAEGSIEARVGEVLRIALSYRESHASVPSTRYEFSGVGRFLTARIAGAL